MKKILNQIEIATEKTRKLLTEMEESGGLTRERYIRFLSMQYNLTKGVEKHFLALAEHPATESKIGLRKWLVNFAHEEDSHYNVAKSDLAELGATPLDCPLDTKVWWLYFDSVIPDRPYVRLGGTCILENIGDGSADILDRLISKAGFLNPKNLKFLIIHRHGPNLAHGEQVLSAIENADLSERELDDIHEGSVIATTFYLRMVHWVITGETK